MEFEQNHIKGQAKTRVELKMNKESFNFLPCFKPQYERANECKHIHSHL